MLGEGSISVFADHPSHIDEIDRIDAAIWPGQIPVWILIDVGDHREGIAAESAQLADIAKRIKSSTKAVLAGVYTHMGSSYSSNSPREALGYMAKELEGLKHGAVSFLNTAGLSSTNDGKKISLSLGASPTATSTQNLLFDSDEAKQYRAQIEEIKKSFDVEFHAGVYPVMDMQQMATRARPQKSPLSPNQSLLSYSDLGFRILVEVASLYPDRTDKPEALIAAGSIALGREPCKSYPGWAVVTPWPAKSGSHYDPETSKTGWIVGRISQEHGILTWEGPTEDMRQLTMGEKLMLWPNHACIAGVNFGWYLVVDSDKPDRDVIQDVWMRWRGW
jgi:D-serine ammonia-lyase